MTILVFGRFNIALKKREERDSRDKEKGLLGGVSDRGDVVQPAELGFPLQADDKIDGNTGTGQFRWFFLYSVIPG
jgi:hypothetical protein